ncbi:hypothetical protein PLESTF_001926400 [Pleodorina starrii]|nr:hypothetical protein PLESTF_001926400 [Pleodorina starrii]
MARALSTKLLGGGGGGDCVFCTPPSPPSNKAAFICNSNQQRLAALTTTTIVWYDAHVEVLGDSGGSGVAGDSGESRDVGGGGVAAAATDTRPSRPRFDARVVRPLLSSVPAVAAGGNDDNSPSADIAVANAASFDGGDGGVQKTQSPPPPPTGFAGPLPLYPSLDVYGCRISEVGGWAVFNVSGESGYLLLLTTAAQQGTGGQAADDAATIAAGQQEGAVTMEDYVLANPNGAKSGCKEVLEWLVERGCPFPLDGGAYLKAAFNGDLAMLRCLHRLGCPWARGGRK